MNLTERINQLREAGNLPARKRKDSQVKQLFRFICATFPSEISDFVDSVESADNKGRIFPHIVPCQTSKNRLFAYDTETDSVDINGIDLDVSSVDISDTEEIIDTKTIGGRGSKYSTTVRYMAETISVHLPFDEFRAVVMAFGSFANQNAHPLTRILLKGEVNELSLDTIEI